jgi:hypothetical protein
LKKFYKFYFCRILNCDEKKVNEAKLNKLNEFLYWKIEHRKYLMISNKDIKTYYDLIIDTFKDISSLDEKTFLKIVSDYFVTMKLIQKLEAYGQYHQIIKVATAFKNIIAPFYVTYKNVFAVDPLKKNQFVYQELFTPSEIISILTIAKTPSPTIYKAISKL